MSAWSNLEVMLSVWFYTVSGIKPNRLSNAIFFSGRGFAARIDMLMAALPDGKQPPQITPLLREILLKAVAYAYARNRLAHSFFDTTGMDDKLLPGRAWNQKAEGLTETELLNASRNFSDLSTIVYDAWMGNDGRKRRGKPSPKVRARCLERLLRLPSEACSSELSQNQKGRLRQFQSAQRSARRKGK